MDKLANPHCSGSLMFFHHNVWILCEYRKLAQTAGKRSALCYLWYHGGISSKSSLALDSRYATQAEQEDVQGQGQPNNKTCDKNGHQRNCVRHAGSLLTSSRFWLGQDATRIGTAPCLVHSFHIGPWIQLHAANLVRA